MQHVHAEGKKAAASSFLDALASRGVSILTEEAGLPADVAEAAMRRLSDALSRDFARRSMYLSVNVHAEGKKAAASSFLDALASRGVSILTEEAGLPADVAEAAMRRLSDALSRDFARRRIYLSVNYSARDEEIMSKWRTDSPRYAACTPGRRGEVAEEYGMTARRLRSIVDKRALRGEAACSQEPLLSKIAQ